MSNPEAYKGDIGEYLKSYKNLDSINAGRNYGKILYAFLFT